ncbi:PRC-barrel domain-containing protein [Phycisphaerales bacterium AB-hyl4]|uniref:PRC-barrel domain-containing protein n=1 Tax=Natronomicrosphaera hydrolytica TaxID=3242702 RepID=A0ABV4U8F7_9BACT
MHEMLVTPTRRLLHQTVYNLQGLTLGEIEELVVDLDRGYIAYAVLTHHTHNNTKHKRFVIPWSAFSINADGQLRLNLQPEVFRNAQGLLYDEASPSPPAASLASVLDDAPSSRWRATPCP